MLFSAHISHSDTKWRQPGEHVDAGPQTNHPVIYSTRFASSECLLEKTLGSSDVRDNLAECTSKSGSVAQFCVKPLWSIFPPMRRMPHCYMKPTGTNKKCESSLVCFRKGDRKPQISQFLSTLFHSLRLNNTKNLTSRFHVPPKYSSVFAQTCKKRNI